MRTESFIAESFIDKLLYRWRSSKAQPYIKSEIIVVDLGCGTNATFLKKIESKIKAGFGFDLNTDPTSSSAKIKVQSCDLNRPIDFPDHLTDIVVSFATLEHLHDYQTYITEMSRILRPEGIAILTTPATIADPILKILSFLRLIDSREIKDHKKYFTKNELEELFRKAGFQNIEVKSFQLGFNQLVIAQK
jgi:ubiquinone/menaquinone biosynthesis C-methylase UbiE